MYRLTDVVYGIIIAFAVSAFLCPVLIPVLRKMKFGQNVRDDGPKSHLKKTGTPTMGGIIILIGMLVGAIFFVVGNIEGAVVLLVTLGYGIIGFIDDYIKVVKKRSLGLRAKEKILLQIIVTTLFLYYLISSGNNYDRIFIPFGAGKFIDLGFIFIPFFYIVMIGTVNSVNLTDGLDGLAAGVTVLVTIFFGISSWAADSGILPMSAAAVGSLLGFLLFNSYPAKVFMGDTGSLALGGFVASMALVLKMPLFILIVGFVYVMEALSVMIQVLYYKKTGGKRFFKMAPIHHHFEECGFSETRIVAIFYITTAMLCLIGYLGARGIF